MRIAEPSLIRSLRRRYGWFVAGALSVAMCGGTWWWIQDDADASVSPTAAPRPSAVKAVAESASVVEVSAPEPAVAPEPKSTPSIVVSPPPEAVVRVDPPKADARASVMIAQANELARTQPAQALRTLVRIPESVERDVALVHAASQWAVIEPMAATAWTAEMVPGALREQVCAAVAIAQAEKDPRGAAEFVATQISEGVPLRNAAVAVAQRWVQSDGPAAMEWVTEFRESEVRRMAMDATLRVWTATDPAGFARWIKNLPAALRSEEIRGVLAAIEMPKR